MKLSRWCHQRSALCQSRHGRARGQAQVEFALVIVFLMILVLSMLEIVMLVHTYNVLADAAKEGVRYTIVHGSHNSYAIVPPCPCAKLDGLPAPAGTTALDPTNTYGVVKTFAQYSLHDTTGMTVNVNYPGGDATPANKTPNRVQITVSYPYRAFFGLGWPTVTVYAAAEGRIMN
ncbi:MAG: TadE/TadG family type IV pilus assembly protein [Terriglobales bacterium]